MRRVLTGFRSSPGFIPLGWSSCGCDTLINIEYLPLLWESPLVSCGSAIKMYAIRVVRLVQGNSLLASGTGGRAQVHRWSPPAASAASIAAITRLVIAPVAAIKALTAFGTTLPVRIEFAWIS